LPDTTQSTTDVTGTIPPPEPIRKAATLASELEMVYFDYDKSDLRPDALPILDRNAEWLLQHPGLQVQIEGHCDERGTIEYNLALGQRRAESVREYLIKKGVDANIIHTISYGKERPLAFGDSDADHRMNRRAQFLIFTQ
jgi:peptidoglycan-associated lipoprotein